MQDDKCIFCQLIQGRVPARKVYEDDDSVAVLDINPANPGHILLLPKEHVALMHQLKDMGRFFVAARNLSHSLLRVLKAQGTSIFIANGAAAGQKAPHFMVHIIPRFDDDSVRLALDLKEPDTGLEEVRHMLLSGPKDEGPGAPQPSGADADDGPGIDYEALKKALER